MFTWVNYLLFILTVSLTLYKYNIWILRCNLYFFFIRFFFIYWQINERTKSHLFHVETFLLPKNYCVFPRKEHYPHTRIYLLMHDVDKSRRDFVIAFIYNTFVSLILLSIHIPKKWRDLNEDKARPGPPSNFDGRIRARDVPSSKLRLERSQSRNGTNVSHLGVK